MAQSDAQNIRAYVESLRWRRGDLEDRISKVREEMEVLAQQEGSLRQEVRAVEQLLSAANPTTNGRAQASDGPAETVADRRSTPNAEADLADFSGFGPTARRIYASAEQALLDAGVPLHYRVLADEVQKTAPLSGRDSSCP
jgi:hypothetical protein